MHMHMTDFTYECQQFGLPTIVLRLYKGLPCRLQLCVEGKWVKKVGL